MKNYIVIADPNVKNDLKEAKNYLNSKRKNLGSIFLKQYQETLNALQQNPHFQIRYNNIHCLPLKKFKYMIHFKVNHTKKIVHIYAVLSTHLNPKQNWK